MIVKFINPCPNCTLDGSSFLNKSKVKFSTEKGFEVVSPYNGKITNVTPNGITIKHIVHDEEWVSELKGFYPNVSVNQHVFGRKQIGYTKSGKLSFKVSPNVNVEDLITIGINTSKHYGKKSDDDKSSNRRMSSSNDDSMDSLLSVFLSPVSFVQGALNLNKSKDLNEQEIEEKSKLIKEDINRIKNLF